MAKRISGIVLLAILGTTAAARADDANDWLATPAKEHPVRTGLSLVDRQVDVAGAEVSLLKLNFFWTGLDPVFNAAGDTLYLLDERGVLRQIETATMTEQLRLSLGVPCSSLTLSNAGLVVSSQDNGTHWVISPQTLAITRKITVVARNTRRLAACPSQDYAYLTYVRPPGSAKVLPLARINLRTGEVSAAEWVEPKEWPRGTPQHQEEPVLSADGRYAFLASWGYSLMRFRVDGARLVFEDRSHDKGPVGNGYPILFAGGKYAGSIALSGDLDHTIPGRPGMYVYEPNRLDKPAMVLPAAHGLALDIPRQRAFSLDGDTIIGMELDGQERWRCDLPQGRPRDSGPDAACGLWLSPSGKELLAKRRIGEPGIYWLRIPPDLLSVRDGNGAPAPVASSDASIQLEPRKAGGTTITDLSLRPQDVLPHPLIDGISKTLTVLSPDGVLRQYGTADWRLRRQLTIGRPCAALRRSSEGLTALVRNPTEIWLLEEESLAVKRRIPIAHATDLACDPHVSWAFAIAGIEGRSSLFPIRLIRVDLRTGQLSRVMDVAPDAQSITHEGAARYGEFAGAFPRLSHDGKTLWTCTPGGPQCYRWVDDRLLRDGSAKMGCSTDLFGMAISDDGMYLAVCGPKTAVFWTRILEEPALPVALPGLDQDYTGPIAIDSDRQRVYVVKEDVLHTLDALGKKVDSASLPDPLPKPRAPRPQTAPADSNAQVALKGPSYPWGPGIRDMVLDTRNDRLLVLTGNAAYWVELPPRPIAVSASRPADQWVGDPVAQARMAARVQGRAVESNEPLQAETQEVDGSQVTTFLKEQLKTFAVDPRGLVPSILWSGDGKSFFLLRKDGLLRKISAVGGFREIRRFQFPQGCHSMTPGPRGPLIAGSAFGDLYQMREGDLSLDWRRTVSDGPLGHVFSVSNRGDAQEALVERGWPVTRLTRISLVDGKAIQNEVPVETHVKSDSQPGAVVVRWSPQWTQGPAVMHPDGRSLWTFGWAEVLRSEITPQGLRPKAVIGGLVTPESKSRETGFTVGVSRLQISGDGKYVAFDSAQKIKGFPKFDHSATFVFRTERGEKPILTIEHDEDGGAVAFADAQKLLYEYSCGGRLRVYRSNGDRLKEFAIAVKPASDNVQRIINREEIECMSVRPDGKALVILTNRRLRHVLLPDGLFPKEGE